MTQTRHIAAVAAALAVLAAVAVGLVRSTPVAGLQPDGSYLIPPGQTLTPAGAHIEVSERPLGMVLSPDGRFLAVVTGSNFRPRALEIIDVKGQKLAQSLALGRSFVGVAFSNDGDTLYVGGTAGVLKDTPATGSTSMETPATIRIR